MWHVTSRVCNFCKDRNSSLGCLPALSQASQSRSSLNTPEDLLPVPWSERISSFADFPQHVVNVSVSDKFHRKLFFGPLSSPPDWLALDGVPVFIFVPGYLVGCLWVGRWQVIWGGNRGANPSSPVHSSYSSLCRSPPPPPPRAGENSKENKWVRYLDTSESLMWKWILNFWLVFILESFISPLQDGSFKSKLKVGKGPKRILWIYTRSS